MFCVLSVTYNTRTENINNQSVQEMMHLVVIFIINNYTRSIVDPNKQKLAKSISSRESTLNPTITTCSNLRLSDLL